MAAQNCVCTVGAGPDDIRAESRFPTTTPKSSWAQTDFVGAQRKDWIPSST